jgi:hypothetical protein
MTARWFSTSRRLPDLLCKVRKLVSMNQPWTVDLQGPLVDVLRYDDKHLCILGEPDLGVESDQFVIDHALVSSDCSHGFALSGVLHHFVYYRHGQRIGKQARASQTATIGRERLFPGRAVPRPRCRRRRTARRAWPVFPTRFATAARQAFGFPADSGRPADDARYWFLQFISFSIDPICWPP